MSKCWLLIIKESCSNPPSRSGIFLDFRSLRKQLAWINYSAQDEQFTSDPSEVGGLYGWPRKSRWGVVTACYNS